MYFSFDNPRPATGVDVGQGVIVRYDERAREVIGLTIVGVGRQLEAYVKRLQTLEAICDSFKGVEKAYAIQAGREVRVIVQPEPITDLEAIALAREMKKKVESSIEFPGQIKITVIRETRAIEYAR